MFNTYIYYKLKPLATVCFIIYLQCLDLEIDSSIMKEANFVLLTAGLSRGQWCTINKGIRNGSGSVSPKHQLH